MTASLCIPARRQASKRHLAQLRRVDLVTSQRPARSHLRLDSPRVTARLDDEGPITLIASHMTQLHLKKALQLKQEPAP